MKVSLHTIKQYIDFELPEIDVLVDKINRQLGCVEDVINLGEKYKGAVIVRVVSAQKHPNADRLSICMIDDGGTVKDIKRDEQGHVKVVCGAPNVNSEMYAVWLPPGTTVPSSYGDAQPFVLNTREIRGEMSNGMLAAADELALGTDHSGIIEINVDEILPSKVEIAPGVSFAKAYGLDDYVVDIENKMFTHRPDLFGQLGIAREIAGIFEHSFSSPEWYMDVEPFSNDSRALPLRVFNEAKDKTPRYMAVAMNNVTVAPSPLWLQCALVAMGGKPINNVVDITNYIMLITSQPTHAYDYDKLQGKTLGARMAKKGETAKLLNGKTYELSEDDIVIVDGKSIVGLGGIMGGSTSEVSSNTKNIVLEVANFDMYTVRKSSMRHGLFTDALTRFNKGQSRLQNDHVLQALVKNMRSVCGAEIASEIHDLQAEYSDNYPVVATTHFINERLGIDLSLDEIRTLLENVEITVSDEDGSAHPNPADKDYPVLLVWPPFWRTDIEIAEDIVEEVGRLYGFDKLPRELPKRTLRAARKNPSAVQKQYIRSQLLRSGANEVLTYSFIHEKTLTVAGQLSEHAFKLSNAISPNLQYYRLSLTPSLLDKVHMNVKAGHDEFAMYEINKVHFKGEMDEQDQQVPNEDTHVAVVIAYSDKKKPTGAAYYQARHYLEQIIDHDTTLRPLVSFDLANDLWGSQLVAPYDPERSAILVKDNQIWGVVGEFKQNVAKAFKLPAYSAGFEVHINITRNHSKSLYRPLSKYPSTTQDISLRISSDTPFDRVYEVIRDIVKKQKSDIHIDLQPLTVYQASDSAEYKTISVRITVTNYVRTMTDKDVNKIMSEIERHAATIVRAEKV